MDTIEILKLVKRKLFEPRKKLIFDTEGKRILADSLTWINERENLLGDDMKAVEEGDGWNVADKTYVDYRISELYKIIQQPSAPFPEIIPQTSSASTKNTTVVIAPKTVFFSQGIINDDVLTFFVPGLVLKKNWNIVEFTIFNENTFDEDVTLSMKTIVDSKITQISKIKSSGKHVVSAEVKQKIDSVKAVVFQLKTLKPSVSRISLQITVEIN